MLFECATISEGRADGIPRLPVLDHKRVVVIGSVSVSLRRWFTESYAVFFSPLLQMFHLHSGGQDDRYV